MKVIGFLSNKLTLRGTEVAMYDYADFNETLLGNKSIIITRDYEKNKHEFDIHIDAYNKFKNRFSVEYYQTILDIDEIVVKNKITHLYIIKGGNNDGLLSSKCINLIHCVFDTRTPHGNIYVSISDWLNKAKKTNIPVIPHMIRVAETNSNFRQKLNIPESAVVFGNYGGADSFNIHFVKEVILRIVNERPDYWFIFMNTQCFCQHPRVLFMEGTSNLVLKRTFINTCDAFIHARDMGETFGLACGEFSVCLKPVITYGNSPDINQIALLKEKAVIYSNPNELYNILQSFNKNKYDMKNNGYLYYNPTNVMNIFDTVFFTLNNVTTKIFINAFWPGFIEGNNPCTINVFKRLFAKTKLGNIQITKNINDADILLESLFGSSLVEYKKWRKTIHYSGEPFNNDTTKYSLVLKCDKTQNNIVNFPLFVNYIQDNGFLYNLLYRKSITKIPPKFCCFIVSNPKYKIRNDMFYALSKYKHIDSCGDFNNNIGGKIPFELNTPEYFNILSQYKFIICFENTKKETYITEKIINAYLSNIIPIYYGSEYVKTIFNNKSMVYLDNESNEEYQKAINRIIELDNDDSKYLEMVNQPVFTSPTIYHELFNLDKIAEEINNVL
jgi:hypothetical protein